MKLQIRAGVFETNSSSTHSLTMMMKSDYDTWRYSGKYLYSKDYSFSDIENGPVDGKLYDKDEVISFIIKASPEMVNTLPDDFDDVYMDYGFKLFTDGSEYLENFYDEFTTPNGETVVAFGEYGYDG